MAWDTPLRALWQRLRPALTWIRRPPLAIIRVRGDSMLPTLADGQYVLTRPLTGRRPLQRGDIIVFRHPYQPGNIYIKRIIAMPNEFIQFTAGQLLIDDQTCPDLGPVADANAAGRDYPRRWHTGDREYFVLGDNRSDSADSRRFGPVPRELIAGRVWLYRRAAQKGVAK